MIKKIWVAEKGEGLVGSLYSLLVLTIILFIGIDIAGYAASAWKIRNACSETLTLMKMENGFDSTMEDIFYKFIDVQGLDPASVAVTGTPPKVQRGEVVSIKASMPYKLKSLRPLNQEITFVISVEMWGLAQDFVKEGE